ncbi:MAG: allantoinase AllB [Actinomycetota bacterium]|nr:allantoinase AllB [Actinomycetota bacterium]
MSELLFRARRCVTGGAETEASVRVRAGAIVAVEPFDADAGAARVITLAADEVLLPGLVDTHVHVNEPGRTEWEGFVSATRAAAAGGITTIIDMPLNSLPPTTDVRALEIKRAVARDRVHVDVGFWGGAVPGNAGELAAMHAAGVFGFKCFLLDSGVEEFPPLAGTELIEHLRVIGGLGSLLVVHAEDGERISVVESSPSYDGFLASRPDASELGAIETVIAAAAKTGARAHIVHLSTSDALPSLAGSGVTVETCPHYLTFAADEVPDGATEFKCCPPIRGAENRERLWRGLADGVIGVVVSDHSPCVPELKTADFGTAWGGVASLQLGLPVVWTGARERGFSLVDVARWMASAPADLVGLARKGRIAAGYDADLTVFAPDEEFTVDRTTLLHRNPVTPYHGRRLTGVVRSTWLRGVEVSSVPTGLLLERGTA